ncbi:50S ribosomal protein L13, partial [Gorgonomyces haynaldii]
FSQNAKMNGLAHSRVWHIVDAKDKILGRLAQRIGIALRGKHKPHFHPMQDCGDYVIVKNCKDIAVTGNKMTDKEYHWHTGFPGGLKTRTMEELMARNACAPIKKAVYGVLPKNNLRKVYMSRLFLFEGEEHPYEKNALKDYDPQNQPIVPIHKIK